MEIPPRDCPCGRRRSGGTLVQSEYLGRNMPRGPLSSVSYLHRDGECIWHRKGANAWRHSFLRVGEAA